ncbi:SDR family NAD(P)-dependent oxidoreductase [Streptomyces sp. NPDC093598]|uniref:SDR family NAD(P)-dependent oxidoreductase n=1 Tax=Streptomyces sp. NPDC093598 TaxID=3366046 RepID=UPI0038071958
MSGSGAMEPSLVREIAAAVRAVPGVQEAVAVVRQSARTLAPAPPTGAAAVTAPAPHAAAAPPEAAGGKPSSELYGGDLTVPEGGATTLQEALRQAAALAPDKGTVYVRAGHEPELQTYPELLAEAERVLAGLRAAGLEPGDAALFLFADHRSYMTAFWACVMGGFVPTPVALATTYTAHNEANRKLRGAWELCGHPVLLTDEATAPALREVRTLWGESTVRVLSVDKLAAHPADHDWYPATGHTPVINLLTSGSTGVPKCVQHTHASVTARTWAAAQGRGYTEDDVSVIWMPLDHVTMVFYNIRDVFLRCLHVNGRIDDFLGDPLLWLDLLDRYRATNTWAPNFAFNLVNEYADRIAAGSWDLSTVREFANGGEPVIAATCRRFLQLLAPHGLRPDAMAPAWGMSETCSGVTYATQSRDDERLGTVVVAPSSFDGDLRFAERGGSGKDAVSFSTVGAPLPGVRIRVVDAQGATLPQDRIGELQIRGVTMMRGYHGNPEADRAAFDADGWFRTGDLAFVHDGHLVIAGRKKDQIVVRGANYVAHELENVIEEAEGVRVTYAAATGVREPGEGSDRLVVFFVPTRWDEEFLDRTLRDIRARLGREVGLAPDLIVPVTTAEFPKTASGKIQRNALVTDLKAGRFADRVPAQADDARDGDGPEQPSTTWFFRRRWARLDEAAEDTGVPGEGVRLVLAGPGDLVGLGLEEGRTVIVGEGTSYVQESPVGFRAAPDDAGQLARVIETVTAQHGAVSTVVCGWTLPTPGQDADPAARLAEVTARITALVKALERSPAAGAGRPLLLVLTTGAVHVRPGDRVDLGVCAVPGLIRTAVTEVTAATVRQLDLPADRGQWAAALRGELADRTHGGVVAARDGLRWQSRLRPLGREETTAPPQLVPGGLYLVTGGLGGVALDVAGYLLAAYGVKLLLVGRSEATGEKAEALAGLSALGEVHYVPADVADAEALRAAVDGAEERFGRALDGVLHLAAADVTGQWSDLERHTLARETAAGYARQYRAKVSGTLAVAQVLESRPWASLVLFGSVNGEFGGRSFGAYSAANTFLVGFADHWRHERGRDVRCLAWSMWEGVGMNRGRSAAPARQRGFTALSPDDGLRAFLAATALPDPYLLVGLDPENPVILAELATDELSTREILVAYTAGETDPEAVHTALEPVLRDFPVPVRLLRVAHIPKDAAGVVDSTELLLDAAARRPARHKAHEAPAGDLERRIAVLWGDVLQQSVVGRSDSFFDVGGNSLRATRLLARLDEEFGIRLTANELYENPTVAGLGRALTAAGVTVAVPAGAAG